MVLGQYKQTQKIEAEGVGAMWARQAWLTLLLLQKEEHCRLGPKEIEQIGKNRIPYYVFD
tara:strand:+ start:557 stop:736 length:180 start_codon:yes stop_codon:yes gene_type:complete